MEFLTHKNEGIVCYLFLSLSSTPENIMSKIKTALQKVKTWYIGRTDYSIGQMIGRYVDKPPIQPEFKPPLIARILNPICRFLRKHGKWIIRTLIAFAILVVMIVRCIKE